MSRRRPAARRTPLLQILAIVIGVLVILIAVIVAIALSQGDGDDDNGDDSTPTSTPSEFGPAPTFTEHILGVTPAHGTRVPQSTTRSPDPVNPNGVCATINLEGLPEDSRNLWFRMAYDDAEVTQETSIAPSAGFICFAPEEGLAIGRHTAAVVLQDPTNPDSEPTEVVAWEFEVIAD